MNKKIMVTALVLAVFSAANISIAADYSASTKTAGVAKNEQTMPAPPEFNGPPPAGFHKGHPNGNFHKYQPSKTEMNKKKAEIDKRLKLTDEQKKQIEANRLKSHEQAKPVFEQMKVKHHELRAVYKDNTLSKADKDKKAAQIREEIKNLRIQADTYRDENFKAFEAILTDKQKKEFAKIKEEQKKDIEKRKAEFEKKMEKAKKEGKHPEGFPPPPPKFGEAPDNK